MKTRNVLFLLLLSSTAFAQLPQKGDWLVGADVVHLKFPVSKPGVRSFRSAEIALMGGAFISDQVALGVSVPFGWQSVPIPQTTQRSTTLAYGIIPFARYYVTNTRVRPYLEAGAGYLLTSYRGERNVSHNGLTYNGNIGLAYFLNRYTSLDVVANFTSRPYQAYSSFSVSNDNQFNFHLRFQIFLGK